MSGKDRETTSAILATKVGILRITGDCETLHAITFMTGAKTGGASSEGALPPLLHEAIRQLEQYFSGRRQQFELPLRLQGTPFQIRVWRQIAAIAYGSVSTYREIGVLLGSPRLARAVGAAAHRNPLPIVVPCHRVVAAGGKLGGFAPGAYLKQVLLGHEGICDRG